MSFLAGAAVTDLGLNISPFTQGILQAESAMSLFPNFVTSFMANPLLGLASLAKSVFSTITDLILNVTNEEDNLNDMATNAGVAIEALSGLGLAAESAGSTTAAVADAFKFLGKNVADASSGSDDAARAFRELGIATADASGQSRPLEDIMFDVADALAATEQAGKRTQIAMRLLGRSGTDLISTLSQGSPVLRDQIRMYDEYGAVVHKSSGESADAFNDLLSEAKAAWDGIRHEIAEPLRDALTPILRSLLTWIRTHPDEIKAAIKSMVDVAVAGIDMVMNQLDSLQRKMAGIALSSVAGGGIGALIGGGIAGPGGAMAGFGIGSKLGGAAATAVAIHQLNIEVKADAERFSKMAADKMKPHIEKAMEDYNDAFETSAQRNAIREGL